RGFRDIQPYTAIASESRYDHATGELVLVIRNTGKGARAIITQPVRYLAEAPRHHMRAPGDMVEDRWAIAASGHWYDIELRCGGLARRWAGHIETGSPSHSDPALDSA